MINEEESSEYAKINNMDLIITSAKTGQNVEQAFIQITKTILDLFSDDS